MPGWKSRKPQFGSTVARKWIVRSSVLTLSTTIFPYSDGFASASQATGFVTTYNACPGESAYEESNTYPVRSPYVAKSNGIDIRCSPTCRVVMKPSDTRITGYTTARRVAESTSNAMSNARLSSMVTMLCENRSNPDGWDAGVPFIAKATSVSAAMSTTGAGFEGPHAAPAIAKAIAATGAAALRRW